MSRFYTYTSNRMPSMASTTNGRDPATPVKNGHSRPDSKMQSSPFSDYFTDDGQSNGTASDSSYRAPSAETQQLLVRLNKLQAQLMRSSPEDVLSEHEKAVIVERKIGEIETHFLALNSQTHSQTRLPPELEDSGLFMEEESDEVTPNANSQVDAILATDVDGEDMEAKDALLKDAQKVLDNVNKANERLRHLYAEVRANHEKCGEQIEKLSHENAKLRSGSTTLEFDNSALQSSSDNLKTENEGLKTDLSFNRADLLFLKLRHRALEVEIEALHNGAQRLETYAPDMKEEVQQTKRAKIRERMEVWESEWMVIDQRMRERRTKYGVPSEVDTFEALLEVDHTGAGADAVEIKKISLVGESSVSALGEDSAVGMDDDSSSEPEESATSVHFDKGTQTDPPSEQTHSPKAVYTSQLIQTSPLPSPVASWLYSNNSEAEAEAEAHSNADAETNPDDCAITTSSEDNGDYSDSDSDVSSITGEAPPPPTTKDFAETSTPNTSTTPTTSARTAWYDLWEGLTNLAGMGEGY